MTIAVSSIGSAGDTNARSAYTCALSATPGTDELVLVTVSVADNAGTAVEPTGVVGAGMVFSLVTSSVTFGTIANGAKNLSVWRSMSALPDNSMVTATLPNAGLGCNIMVHSVSGVSKSGLSGIKAVGQSSISSVDVASTLRLVSPSAASTVNGWFAVHSSASSEAAVPGQGYVSLGTIGFLTPDLTLGSAWTTLSTGTIVIWTSSGVDAHAGVIVELVADNPAAVPSVSAAPLGKRFRIPEVPSYITGPIGTYLQQVVRQLNNEAFISLFSGADPNTSGFTGIPGNILMNIGSASSRTRMWAMEGSVASIATNTWRPFRMA